MDAKRYYMVRKPGNVLRLHRAFGNIPAGEYVLLSVGDKCGIAPVVQDGNGTLRTINRLTQVSLAELCRFTETGLCVEPLQ